MSRRTTPYPKSSRAGTLLLVTLALATVALGAADGASAARESCARPAADAGLRLADGRLPNVLLLTVDTLRADHVAYHGGPFPGLTPALDQLATESTVFLAATSPAPATRPAIAGLMSGAYVGRHRVASNHGVVPPTVPLLAETLRAHGYATAAFYGNGVLGPKSGLARGFATFRDFTQKGRSDDARGVALASDWLASAPREPWLLWLHLMSPHGPYNSAPAPPPMVRPLEDPLPDVAVAPAKSNYGLGPMVPKYQILARLKRAAEYRQRYREEVFFADAQVAQVVARLDALGLRDSTLIVFTADHGEGLGEHDYYFQHGWLPNEPSVHVPLLVSLPCRVAEGARVEEPVSLVDVLPTLLAGLGIDPPPGLEGRDLGPALAGRALPDAPSFTLTAYVNQMTALRRGSWKLVHTPPPPRPLPRDWWRKHYARKESWALYELASDPGETRDRAADEPERVAAMRDELARWETRNGVALRGRELPQVDPRQREMLRALGYVD